jgi:hypothetical protein
MAKEHVGTLRSMPLSGVFALCDVKALDKKWIKGGVGGSYVDISGPNAEALAGREGQFKRQTLSDGTIRLPTTDQQTAEGLRMSITTRISQMGWTDRVDIRPLASSSTQAIDGSRTGVGIVEGGLVLKAETIEVHAERDESGKVIRVVLEIK